MTAQTTHVRDVARILNLSTKQVEDHKTINAAKRASRQLQASGAVVRKGKVKRDDNV